MTTIRPDALPPGTRLDEYEIGPLLSESPLGLVYLAIDHSLGRKVAIREYLPSALSGRGDGPLVALRSAGMADAYRRGLRAFIEEARLLARFDDPSLLRVLRFWEAHFTAYIVMPFYDAPTLSVARERLEIPPAEPWIRSLVESLANVLELLHGESCLHRNVTPERVLMLRDGRPLLLGPSAVRQVLGRDAHTSLIQPGFSAIEEYAESSDLPQGPWTDVYALGALARFCILGMAPVAAPVRSVRDPLVGMQDALFPLRVQWPELVYSRSLLDAIDRALCVDPARRPQSMAEFRALLNAPSHERVPSFAAPADPAATHPPLGPEPVFDPTRPEPDLHLLSATDLEADAFEASLSAMVDAALVDAPPMRTARDASPSPSVPPPSVPPLSAPPPPTTASAMPRAATSLDGPAGIDLSIPPAFDDHGTGGRHPAPPPGRPGWQRGLTAAMAVLLLGAIGWVGWTQYRHMQDDERIASRVPIGAMGAAPAASAAACDLPGAATDPTAEASRQPPAAGPAEASTHVPPVADFATTSTSTSASANAAVAVPTTEGAASAAITAEAGVPPPAVAPVAAPTAPAPAAPALAPASKAPARTERLARAAAREARAARAPAEPREVCGARTDFALYRCMQTQCDRPQFAGNAQCRQFKLEDRVP